MKKKVFVALAALAGLSMISVKAQWFGKAKNKVIMSLKQKQDRIKKLKKEIFSTKNVEKLKKYKEQAKKVADEARKTKVGQAVEAEVKRQAEDLQQQAVDAAQQAIQDAQDKIIEQLPPYNS